MCRMFHDQLVPHAACGLTYTRISRTRVGATTETDKARTRASTVEWYVERYDPSMLIDLHKSYRLLAM